MVVDYIEALGQQIGSKRFEVDERKRGMSFPRRAEIRVDADVDLLGPASKPASSAAAQCFRLFDFIETENPPVELAGEILAVHWRG